MIESALFWVILNLLTIMTLAFFSMEEMACVSFNRIRLQYYVSQGNYNALLLNSLIQNPSQLFGTTLIGVNVATFIGSECARRFYSALHLSPDLAPLSQVMIVIIFGELVPMFAARQYSEHVALSGIRILTICAKLLSPAVWILGKISELAHQLLGGSKVQSQVLTHDELQKILTDQDERLGIQDSETFNTITKNIFRLRGKNIRHVMSPLNQSLLISSQTSIQQLRQKGPFTENYLIVYHNKIDNIIGIVFIKDLLRATDNKKLREFCNPPWFISVSTPLLETLKYFRLNSENIAIILDRQGQAIGSLAFEDILDEIFEKTISINPRVLFTLIDKTLNGNMKLEEFNSEFNYQLPGDPHQTLSSWLVQSMERHPEPGDVYCCFPYEFTIKETTLLDVTRVQVKNSQ